MNKINEPPVAQQIHDIHRSLNGATDDQIIRIVATVDALPVRGSADELVVPLRRRLAHMRPSRPLTFNRLLFSPIDPIVVSPADFQLGEPNVSRIMLSSLAQLVRTAVPNVVIESEAIMKGHSFYEIDLVARIGAVAWPAAAHVFRNSPSPPPAWNVAHLPSEGYVRTANGIAGVLEHATLIQRIVEASANGAGTALNLLNAVLDSVMRSGIEALDMVIAILIVRMRDPAPLLSVLSRDFATSNNPTLKARAERAAGAALTTLSAHAGANGLVSKSQLRDVGSQARQITSLIDALASYNKTRQHQLELLNVRDQIQATFMKRFDFGIQNELVAPIVMISKDAGNREITDLEDRARNLRQLEAAGRRLGGGESYSASLKEALEKIRNLPDNHTLNLIDRVRIVEILAGSGEALSMINPKK